MKKIINCFSVVLLFVGLTAMIPQTKELNETKQLNLLTKNSKFSCGFTFHVQNLSSANVTEVYLWGEAISGSFSTNYTSTISPSATPVKVYGSNLINDQLLYLNGDSYITLDNEWYGSIDYVDLDNDNVFKTVYFNGGTTHNISISSTEVPNICVNQIKLVIKTDY